MTREFMRLVKTVAGGCSRLSEPPTAISRWRRLGPDCRGSLLLESVVVAMVFSLVGTAVLAGMNTAYTSGARVDAHARAENIARNQIEAAFGEAYKPPGQTPYPAINVPAGYSVSVVASDIPGSTPDPDIEQLVVTVSVDGNDVLTLTGLRFNQ